MKILFEIKENLADIENQLLHSDFWITEVEERPEEGKKIVTIRDFAYPQEATAEITDWCEYTGAYRGLLEQKLLPMITPKENLLDQEVTSSLYGNTTAKTLREYAMDNLKLKHFRQQTFGDIGFSTNDHPKRVYDAFIKEDYIPD